MSGQPKVGEFAVWLGWGGNYRCAEILQVTAKKTIVKAYGRPDHLPTGNVGFTGPGDEAKALHERLVSSTARMREEQRAASDRHQKRVDDLIAKAGHRP